MVPSAKAARALAREIVRKKIDSEGKFIPEARYEMTGKQLVDYLAYAYGLGLFKVTDLKLALESAR